MKSAAITVKVHFSPSLPPPPSTVRKIVVNWSYKRNLLKSLGESWEKKWLPSISSFAAGSNVFSSSSFFVPVSRVGLGLITRLCNPAASVFFARRFFLTLRTGWSSEWGRVVTCISRAKWGQYKVSNIREEKDKKYLSLSLCRQRVKQGKTPVGVFEIWKNEDKTDNFGADLSFRRICFF